MTREEAIARIKDHMIVHKMNEPRAIYISEALNMAIKALEQEPCDDCISRQTVNDLVDELARAISDERCCISRGRSTATIMQDILDLPPVTPKQRWIPVSERLPEEDGEYLLWGKVIEDEENYIFIGDYDSCAEAFGYWQNYYDPSTLGYVDGELLEYASVIAWMPLPKPYKAESEEV